MKLYFINRFFYPDHSATSQMLIDLTTRLAEEYSVTVVTSRKLYNDTLTKLDRRDELKGVEILRLNTTRMSRDTLPLRTIDYASFYVRVFVFLLRNIREGDLVVLKTDPPLLSLMNTAAVHYRGGQVVNWLQDVFPEIAMELGALPRGKFFSRPLIWWRNKTLRAAVKNVVISRRMQELLAIRGVTNTRLIPNWADGELIHPLNDSNNPIRSEWNLEGKFVVGYSGNFGRAHSFDALIEAMMLLKDRPEIHFMLIGEGSALERLADSVERKQLKNVSFRPYQPSDTLSKSLGAVDLHLVTLKENMEGLVLPSKIYGVLAAGRPIAFVGDEKGEIAELINKHEVGLTIKHGDGADFAEQIQKLSTDPARLREMGSNARRLFDREYAMPKALNRWRNLLTEISVP